MTATTVPTAQAQGSAQAQAQGQGQIDLVARRLSVVTVRGISYEFSIQGSISDKRCDELVKNHIQYLLTASGRDSFDTITSTLRKNNDPTAEPFSIEKCDVTYVKKDGKQKTCNAKTKYIDRLNRSGYGNNETKAKAEEYWRKTQDQLATLTSGVSEPYELQNQQPVNSNPASSAPAAAPVNSLNPAPVANPSSSTAPVVSAAPVNNPNQAPALPRRPAKTPHSIVKTYTNRLKRTRLPPVTVSYALASQLSEMPSSSYPRESSVDTINKELRKKYVNHIEKNQANYLEDNKFKKVIMTNLMNAYNNPTTKEALKSVCQQLNSAWLDRINIGINDLNVLLSPQGSSVRDPTKKQELLRIHNEFFQKDSALNVNLDTESFVEAFVSSHKGGRHEVVVINEKYKAKLSRCEGNNSSDTPINNSDDNCAFLFIDANDKCHSIPRRKRCFSITDKIAPDPIENVESNNCEVLRNLIDLYDTFEQNSIHSYFSGTGLFETTDNFKKTYSKAFGTLTLFMYELDKQLERPGKDLDFRDTTYGEKRLKQLSPKAFATLLKDYRDDILKFATNKNPTIV